MLHKFGMAKDNPNGVGSNFWQESDLAVDFRYLCFRIVFFDDKTVIWHPVESGSLAMEGQ